MTDFLILDKINWISLSVDARKQQRNREIHNPTISLYRWWARRSHAVFGALLDAAIDQFQSDNFLVSDPFSGGGTVAVEADRRGLAVYAQDIQPWAIVGLQVALDRVSSKDLRTAAERFLASMADVRSEFYGTSCPYHGPGSEIIHTYWVRTAQCPSCGTRIYLYPRNLLTYSQRVERKDSDQTAFFGCAYCGAVHEGHREDTAPTCPRCGKEGTNTVVTGKGISCPHCLYTGRPARFQYHEWEPVLVQRLCHQGGHSVLHIDVATDRERTQARRRMQLDRCAPLAERIPQTKETRRLIEWGYRVWRDLYPGRQMEVYLLASQRLGEMRDLTPQVRTRLLLALCGAAEMAGYSSRWDRFHLKAFEATANHRFSAATFTAEVNPLGPRGRGTLPRRLYHSVRAAEWSEAHVENTVQPTLYYNSVGSPPVAECTRFPALVVGTSEAQRLQSRTVSLVLTDPPYYDDVQYGELVLLFNTWARQLGLFPVDYLHDISREAVANPTRDSGHYERVLQAILFECNRTLAANGRLVFTFHNSKLDGWVALGRALRAAGFCICAIAVVHAENETDHSKRNKRAFSKDLVLECETGSQTAAPWVPSFDEMDDEAVELLAMGRALADPGALDRESLWARFCSFLPASLETRIR